MKLLNILCFLIILAMAKKENAKTIYLLIYSNNFINN